MKKHGMNFKFGPYSFEDLGGYKVGEIKIKSTLPYSYTEEFCIECDSVKPFIGGHICLYCGSFGPVGDFHDEDITEAEWEEYIRVHLKNTKNDR